MERTFTEAQKSWERATKPSRVIRKNRIVRGRGKVIFHTNITRSYYNDHEGRWEVYKVGNTFKAYNRDTGVVMEAPIKLLYKILDGACRDSIVSGMYNKLMENTCEWEDDPFDDFSVRPLYAYGDIEPECEP